MTGDLTTTVKKWSKKCKWTKFNTVQQFTIILVFSNEAIQNVGMMKSASEMENSVFQKVRSQDEYQNMVTKLLMHMQSKYTTNSSIKLKRETCLKHFVLNLPKNSR